MSDQNPNNRPSGWERADRVAEGIGAVAGGIGWVLVKLYALALIAGGIALIFVLPDADGAIIAIGAAVAAYGVYLLLGGSWIIY